VWINGKLNVYKSYTKGLESVINRGLIRSLNVSESSDLGEQSNRNSPKCQGVCYKTSETITFPHIQHFIHIRYLTLLVNGSIISL